MREILFRGKRLDTGEWIERKTLLTTNGDVLLSANVGAPIYKVMPDYVDDNDENIYGVASTEPLFVPVDPETVGQYTGLRDKNGTRIFDGDILTGKSFDKEIFVVKLGKYNQVNSVELTHVGFFAEFYNEPVCGMLRKDLGWWASKCEVIGNIHDNRELLEVNYED